MTVWDDCDVITPWMPPDPIEYKTWDEIKFPIRDSMEPEPFDPLKPNPYVAELTQTGVMTIGWDKKMAPPKNYTFIPEA